MIRTRNKQRIAIAIAAALLLPFVIACSSDKGASETASTMHFILASEKGISEVIDNKERIIAAFGDGSFTLDPALSHDGKQIAFILQPPVVASPDGGIDFGSDLYLVDRAGGKPKLLLKHSTVGEFIRTPSWRPDGTLLVTVRSRDPSGASFDLHIITLDPKTGDQKRYISNAIDPVVAPDGSALVYITIDPDSAEEMLVVNDPGLSRALPLAGTPHNLALIGAVAWTPDSKQLAFAAIDLTAPLQLVPGAPGSGTTNHPFAQDVWLVNRDGSSLRRLSELSDNQPSLSWSPDGRKLYALGVTGFWRIDAATGEREPVGYSGSLGSIIWLGP